MKFDSSIFIKLLKRINIYYLLFVLTFWFAVFLILPLQETGFLDDFAYYQSVKNLYFNHKLLVSEWSSATLVFQVVGAYLFSLLMGFSYKTLHLFTLTLLFAGLTSFFFTLKTLKFDNFKSLLFTLFLFSIPWFLFYGFSFSTDVPYASVQMIAVFFLIRGLSLSDKYNLYIGSALIACSFLIRQLGVGVFAALTIALIYDLRHKKRSFSDFSKILLIPSMIFVIYTLWLKSGNFTVAQLYVSKWLTENLISPLLFLNPDKTFNAYNLIFHRILFYSSQLFGFSFLMLLILKFSINFKNTIREKNFLIFLSITLIVFVIYLIDILLNFSRYGLYIPGVPARYLKFELLFPIPWAHIWKYMIIIAILFLARLIAIKATNARAKFQKFKFKNTTIFLLFAFLIQFIMLTLTPEMYAEYIIAVLPISVILFALLTKEVRVPKVFSSIIISFLILDMIQIVKLNYHLNGLKWQEGLKITESGIDPNYIDIRNYAWPRWFFYEDWMEEQIQKSGNKEGAINNLYYGVSVPKKYVIFSNFDSVKDQGQIIKVIDNKILFVNTRISVSELY